MNRKANIFVQSYVLDAVKAKQYKLPGIIRGNAHTEGQQCRAPRSCSVNSTGDEELQRGTNPSVLGQVGGRRFPQEVTAQAWASKYGRIQGVSGKMQGFPVWRMV